MDAMAPEASVDAPSRGRSALVEALVEALVVVGVAVVYALVHGVVARDAAAATANAGTLQAIERVLRLDVELGTNRWLVAHDALIPLAVVVYRSHFAVILGVLVWGYVRHRDVYRGTRRVLVALTLLVLPVYWAVPMSPPRFALAGTVDIIAEHDPVAGAASRDLGDGATSYTAMPSMHVAWAAWCAYAVWTALRPSHPRLAWLAWLWPLLMVADVFATANHFVLDVVGSAALLGVSIAVARLWGDVRTS